MSYSYETIEQFNYHAKHYSTLSPQSCKCLLEDEETTALLIHLASNSTAEGRKAGQAMIGAADRADKAASHQGVERENASTPRKKRVRKETSEAEANVDISDESTLLSILAGSHCR